MASPERPLVVAAAASAGAGLIHIAAAGAERDRAAVAIVLGALGLAQLAWGVVAATRPAGRTVRRTGAVLAGAALAGWALALTVGLPAPAALREPISPEVPDVVAAACSTVVLAVLGRRALSPETSPTAARPALAAAAVVGVVALGAVVAVPAAHEARLATAAEAAAADDLESRATDAETTTTLRTTIGPYDPARPLDLDGIVGPTAEQRQGAAALVADVLAAVDRYPTAEAAEAAGYTSIGDEYTGEEHLIDWSAVLDPATLDPAHPEALVFDVADDGTRTLAAVMFVLPPSTRLDDAPRPGGDLTRWHLHGELCVDPSRRPPAAVTSTDATGECPAGLVEASPSPTLHVWVTRHPCGPFSELEGVGADPAAVAAGCQHRHG